MACLDEREGKLGACFWTGFLRVFCPLGLDRGSWARTDVRVHSLSRALS